MGIKELKETVEIKKEEIPIIRFKGITNGSATL
jgi:hypothetical protein